MAAREQITLELAEIVADLRCQREASDAIAVAIAAMFLSVLPKCDLITPMREMLHRSIMPPRAEGGPTDTVALLRLRTDQYVADHFDKIEAMMRSLRAGDQRA